MNTHKGLKEGLLKKKWGRERGGVLNNEIQREQEEKKNRETYSDKVEEKLWGKRRSRSAIERKAEVLQEDTIKRWSPLRLYVEANKTARPIR